MVLKYKAGRVEIFCHVSIKVTVPSADYMHCESAVWLEMRLKEFGYDFIMLVVYKLHQFQFPPTLFVDEMKFYLSNYT